MICLPLCLGQNDSLPLQGWSFRTLSNFFSNWLHMCDIFYYIKSYFISRSRVIHFMFNIDIIVAHGSRDT